MLAALCDLRELAELLLERGADPGLTTASQENPARTVLMVAVANARVDFLRLLLHHRAALRLSDDPRVDALEQAKRATRRPFKQSEMRTVVAILEGGAS